MKVNIKKLPKVNEAFPTYEGKTVEVEEVDQVSISGIFSNKKIPDIFSVLSINTGQIEGIESFLTKTSKINVVSNIAIVNLTEEFILCRQSNVNETDYTLTLYIKQGFDLFNKLS